MESTGNQQAIKFFPSEKTSLVVQPMQIAAPSIARLVYRISLSLDEKNRRLLRSLKNRRLLLLPNHPTYMDPVVMFLLSAEMDDEFYYLADHMQLRSVAGPLLQKLGAYSIRRGMPDRESVKHTLDVIKEKKSKLVVFPEGGLSYQNDTIMQLRDGALHLAFKAMSKQLKKEGEVEDLFVVPVSIKYRYKRPQKNNILRLLRRMEKALQVPSSSKEPYERLRIIGHILLEKVEQEYIYQVDKNTTVNERVAALKEHVIGSLEKFFKISKIQAPHRERIYRLLSAIDNKEKKKKDPVEQIVAVFDVLDIAGLKKEESWTDNLGQEWTINFMRKSLYRILNFDAFYDGYVAENPSEERFLDTLTRLEREIFDVDMPSIKGSQYAHVYLGEPFNLKDHMTEYNSNKEEIVNKLSNSIRDTLQVNLDKLVQSTARTEEKTRLQKE